MTGLASYPVPRPAFRCLQYGKTGRAWYISSREHDVIEKWQNFQNEDATFCVLFNHASTRSTLGEYDSRPPLARYVWYVTSYLRSSCCSEIHVRPRFLPVFLPLPLTSLTCGNVPGPPHFTVLQVTKSWAWDWEQGYDWTVANSSLPPAEPRRSQFRPPSLHKWWVRAAATSCQSDMPRSRTSRSTSTASSLPPEPSP